MYSLANRFYKIPYENSKLLKMLFLAIALFVLSALTADTGILTSTLIKIGVLISFPFLLYPLSFYEEIEIERVREGIRKVVRV